MRIELPLLPYGPGALEPVVSRRTVEIHHGRHHRSHLDRLRGLLRDSEVAFDTLEAVVRWSAARRAFDPAARAIHRQAAQAFNHAFYWRSLTPASRSGPSGELLARIRHDFGTWLGFVESLKSAGAAHFGSGWLWLACHRGGLHIVTTGNAQTPITGSLVPLLGIDLWEHAYYLDYQERRADYVGAVVDSLLDWEFAGRNYAGACKGDAASCAVLEDGDTP